MMIVKTVKVSDKAQIAIPLDIREKIGIQKGDELILVQDGQKIMIEPVQRVSDEVRAEFSDLLKLSEKSLKKLWGTKADDVWDQYLEK